MRNRLALSKPRFRGASKPEGRIFHTECEIPGLDEEGKIIRWVFPSSAPSHVDSLYPSILESFEPNNGDIREYGVYGLHFRLPRSYRIEAMNVLPANVMMTFESDRKARATFRRWGMPDVILQGKRLEEFYYSLLRAQGAAVMQIRATTMAGMDAVAARYEQRGEHHLDRFMGRRWKNGDARLWYNRDEQRLYAFEQIGPKGVELPVFEDVFPGVKP